MANCESCGKELGDGYFDNEYSEWYCGVDCAVSVLTKEIFENDIETGVLFWRETE